MSAYPTKTCLEFSSGDTVDLEMKEISRRHIPYRDMSNSHFPLIFSCAYEFLASSDTSSFRSTAPVPSLDQYFLM